MKSKFTKLACYSAPLRILALLLILVICWLPIAAPIALLVKDQNLVTILTMPLLFVGFLVVIPRWGRWLHRDRHIWQTYGLVATRQNGMELLQGLAIGLSSLFILFLLQGWLGWLQWQPLSWGVLKVVVEGSLTGLGTGFIEELVFRGWMLDELQRDYSLKTSLWADSAIFAILHFGKPLSEAIRTAPQFPGLLLLGLTLVWAKRSTHSPQTRLQHRREPSLGRLGLPIGLHAGFVWAYYIVNVGQLAQYTGRVPEWITGIDRNPLAGVLGLLLLSLLAGYMSWRSKQAVLG
ncbi:CPBP family intramembrane metalloprotease [Phormidium tenue FACHB-886]|nr:CPBP family intramembrane metalloprotease [Phormidium tenue FACHB-886]